MKIIISSQSGQEMACRELFYIFNLDMLRGSNLMRKLYCHGNIIVYVNVSALVLLDFIYKNVL